MYMYVCMFMFMYMHMYIHTYVYMYTYMYIYLYFQTQGLQEQVLMPRMILSNRHMEHNIPQARV